LCFIDDLRKKLIQKNESLRKISDAEIITSAMIAAKYFGCNMVKARGYMDSYHRVILYVLRTNNNHSTVIPLKYLLLSLSLLTVITLTAQFNPSPALKDVVFGTSRGDLVTININDGHTH
jgi:hypothetical protein